MKNSQLQPKRALPVRLDVQTRFTCRGTPTSRQTSTRLRKTSQSEVSIFTKCPVSRGAETRGFKLNSAFKLIFNQVSTDPQLGKWMSSKVEARALPDLGRLAQALNGVLHTPDHPVPGGHSCWWRQPAVTVSPPTVGSQQPGLWGAQLRERHRRPGPFTASLSCPGEGSENFLRALLYTAGQEVQLQG